jgi:hypothetical protein
MLAAHTWIAGRINDVGAVCRAQALGVWACPPGRLDLVCAWLTDQRLHNLLHTHWPETVEALRAGKSAPLAGAVAALPVLTREDGLLGALVFAGVVPRAGAARALLEDFQRGLAVALRPPLPPPDPDVLVLPLAHIDAPGGLREAQRRVLAALLACHGGSMTRTAQVLAEARQTLEHRARKLAVEFGGPPRLCALPPVTLEGQALELERETCRAVMERCRGDLKLAAALLHVTPDTWRVYLEGLGVDVPRPPRRRRH